MAGSKQSSVVVDLTMDDADFLSELSDAPPPSPSKPKTKTKNASTSTSPKKASAVATIKKSASSSALSAKSPTKAKPATCANGTAKPKARKSEPIPNKSVHANGTPDEPSKAKAKRKEADGTEPKPSSSRSAPISEVVRARTHVNCEGNPMKICHQHHQTCKGPLLECTFMRAPGKRCQGRYCFSSLKRFYGQDPEAIVKSNRMMINPAEHCPPTETKYAWKCPRCRGKCDCSTCRKAKGLEPLGKWTGPKKRTSVAATDGDTAHADTSKTKKGKSKAKADGAQDAAAESDTAAKSKGKGKAKGNIAEAMAAAGKHTGKGKGKAGKATADVDAADQDDGISTPPPPGSSSKPATKKTLASILGTASVRAPIFKPLKPPTTAPPPTLEVIPTKLPEDNMRARMWIYESMVRFDKFGLNRGVLSQLDKFDNWTHAMAQDMLACLLKTIAGLSNIEKGQPTKPFVKAITDYRAHGKNLQRGEPWSAATDLLTVLGLQTTRLPHVEHDIPVQVEAAAAQRSPSSPALRVTRGRRAKENKQYEVARQLSMLDQWEQDDEFGEAQGGDEDEDDARSNKRRRGSTKKSMYVYDDPSDDDSMADPDDSSRGRRSGRARKPVHKEAAPEVRLTGRQQAIKLQQEQQKEQEAKQRQEEEEEAQESSRKRRSSANGVNGGGSVASDLSDNDDEEKAHTNGRSQKKRRRLTAGSSDAEVDDDDLDSDKEEKDDAETKSNGATEEEDEEDERDQESPDLETKVSILSSLIDAAVMADSVAEELKTAADNIVALERTQRAANAELEKEMAEEQAELNKHAPSIVSREYQKWKAEKAELEASIAWRRLDARVMAELAIDTHALRTGALGYDVDGREYWHLREYQERMPKYTEGRYAWCLVVLGKAFPVDPNQRKEKEKVEGDISMTDAEQETKKEQASGDESGLTSIDGSTSETGKAETGTESVSLGLAKSATDGSDSADTSDKRICMGANDPATIKKLIDYVTYRLEQVEYEENVSMQEREKAVRLGKDSSGGGGGESRSAADEASTNGAAESMYSIRKAKQTLKETQEERRKQVEQLVKRLNKSKEYFAWHREELAP